MGLGDVYQRQGLVCPFLTNLDTVVFELMPFVSGFISSVVNVPPCVPLSKVIRFVPLEFSYHIYWAAIELIVKNENTITRINLS